LEAGAEMARPGEFTQRAYLNGKMDLTQAEAVMDVIAAETELSLRASASQLRGSLFQKTEELRAELMDVMAQAEVNIDYPEYDVPELSVRTMVEACESVYNKAGALYETAEAGAMLREGIRIAIIGAPNVGKSSLLNRLLGEDRAIVTDIPGTTRDTIEEKANLGGIPVRLIDTAGIREATDVVEQIGVERARRACEESDLILFVLDGTRPIREDEDEVFAAIQKKPYCILLNKTDIGTLSEDEVVEHWQKISREIKHRIYSISAKEGRGLEKVEESIRTMFLRGLVVTDHTPMITNVRQKQALARAMEALQRAIEAGKNGFEEDLLMMDIREAYNSLGEISGHSVEEDMIQEIFSRFCLGK
jgi:tRNA modification GTPase